MLPAQGAAPAPPPETVQDPEQRAAELPAGLYSPDHRVVCNRARGVCYDRYGASIGLTEVFLGATAAERLTTTLRDAPSDPQALAVFSPAEGVTCQRELGPCRVQGEAHAGLTAVLYGPWPPEAVGRSAEARSVVGVDWQWLGTRYNNDTEARPAASGHYVLHLEPGGTVRVQADCNRAGGQYRLEDSVIAIEITHSTRAACEPGSLERVFLRDLSAAAQYFIKEGRLYIDLKYDTGTMNLER